MTDSDSNRFRESLTIWPHRSLSPRGFALVMAALGSLAFCIGLGFFLLGAWPVIGFLGLEILVVWVAFKLNYRAAKRRQHLTATSRKLKIENVSPGDKSMSIISILPEKFTGSFDATVSRISVTGSS